MTNTHTTHVQNHPQAYLSKIRSLKFNLAKPDNPDLRRDVLSGRITAERLVTMSAEEMAPEKVWEWILTESGGFGVGGSDWEWGGQHATLTRIQHAARTAQGGIQGNPG